MTEELPEGITFTTEVVVEEIIPSEYYETWNCSSCNLVLESILISPGGRHEGIVRNQRTQSEIWTNKLPRDKDKAIKFLKQNFQLKVENHRKSH
jgi:hypothetical protein